MKPLITIEEYEENATGDSTLGYCLACKDWTSDCCEPDAREYPCPNCGRNTVFGGEECLIMGLVE